MRHFSDILLQLALLTGGIIFLEKESGNAVFFLFAPIAIAQFLSSLFLSEHEVKKENYYPGIKQYWLALAIFVSGLLLSIPLNALQQVFNVDLGFLLNFWKLLIIPIVGYRILLSMLYCLYTPKKQKIKSIQHQSQMHLSH